MKYFIFFICLATATGLGFYTWVKVFQLESMNRTVRPIVRRTVPTSAALMLLSALFKPSDGQYSYATCLAPLGVWAWCAFTYITAELERRKAPP